MPDKKQTMMYLKTLAKSTTLTRIAIFLFFCLNSLSEPVWARSPTGKIKEGKGSFDYIVTQSETKKIIPVYYYRPEGDVTKMPILFVMHGTNRNADTYRDNWVDLAKEYNVLIIVPEFSREYFPTSRQYNYGNIMTKEGVHIPKSEWSYTLIDPIFDTVVQDVQSNESAYDIFGHSAGSQFTHRFAIFLNQTKANRIVSANAGTYTMPDFEVEFPFGLKGTICDQGCLRSAYAKKLVIQLGKEDTDPNHKHLNTSDEAMKQGSHRLERGHNFYERSQSIAKKHGWKFNWSIRQVPGVGHDNRGMAIDAAEYLYGK